MRYIIGYSVAVETGLNQAFLHGSEFLEATDVAPQKIDRHRHWRSILRGELLQQNTQ